MAYRIALDIGGSTTKIVCIKDGNIAYKDIITAENPLKCFENAIAKLKDGLEIQKSDIDTINITGAGSSFIPDNYMDYKLNVVSEYEATGIGGSFLADTEEAIVVSMGTGTAFYKVSNNNVEHIIGTGVGGGTIKGLGKLLLSSNDVSETDKLALDGNTTNVDLTIGDISNGDMPGLPVDLTASNFGKIKKEHSKNDLAAGMYNMIFQTMGTMMVMASRITGINNIVAVGQVSTLGSCHRVLNDFAQFYGINVIIPENSPYATAIGACIIGA